MKVSMRVFGALAITALPLAVVAQKAAAPSRSGVANVQRATSLPPSVMLPCLIRLTEEVQVPAEESGILKKLMVKEGDVVEAGEVLAQIDDTLAQQQLKIAQSELKVAKKQAENTVNVRYSRAAMLVAWAEHQAALEANKKVPFTFPPMEVKRLELTFDRAKLQIEQEQMNQQIAGLEAQVAQAKLDAAQEIIRRRKIKAPADEEKSLSGDGKEASPPTEWVVEELYRHEGEWVEPPQTGQEHVMRLIRADRLWVEGFLRQREFKAAEIDDRPVTVTVELARGQKVTVNGKIVYAGLEVQQGGEFKVRAEIQNPKASDRWLLQSGLRAEMTIHLR